MNIIILFYYIWNEYFLFYNETKVGFFHSTDNPWKPKIQGNWNIMVDSYSELNCSSNSVTAPDYYARLRLLFYIWYVNNTQLDGETRETLRSRVTRNH